jgi:hypothetical protein
MEKVEDKLDPKGPLEKAGRKDRQGRRRREELTMPRRLR